MKNRASLVLMEQLVVILVFLLAASVCLLAFSRAHGISAETARQDRAVDLAVTGCETIKAHRGDLDAAGEILNGRTGNGVLLVIRDDLQMEIRILDATPPRLGQAEVSIFQENTQKCIYSLTVSWQEVS